MRHVSKYLIYVEEYSVDVTKVRSVLDEAKVLILDAMSQLG
jgi:hypothetical protein